MGGRRLVALVAVCGLGSGLVALASGSGPASAGALGYSQLTMMQRRLLSGTAALELGGQGRAAAPLGGQVQNSAASSTYSPQGSGGCAAGFGSNVKVNQNCLNVSDPVYAGRGQAQNETSIAADPNQPNHLVASANDYRRGDGTCGTYWSVNKGQTWNDSTLPNGFVAGTSFGAAREYFQAGGDGSVAWDSKHNAYMLCQMFQRGPGVTNNADASSALYLYRSTGNGGASWNFPGRPVFEQSDNTGAVLVDKPLMTVDASAASPFRDRVYVTWTLFAADGTGYIYGAHSSDYGETFSAPVLISSSLALCTNTFGVPTPQGTCNENQFSQPFVGSDGALYVVWANYNNTPSGTDNRNQILLTKSTDGGATFSAPVKVADYYELPDCATYQAGLDAGRACVPEKGPTASSIFRAANYPSGAVDPTNPNHVVVAFGSYINSHSQESNGCTPTGFSGSGNNTYTGVKTAGACNNDIVLSVSSNGGGSFTGTTTDPRSLPTATSSPRQATTDQWFQWIGFADRGKLAVSYYDRQYGHDETNGFNDVSVSSQTPTGFHVKRATSSSMPPPTQFSGLFWGDYTGMAVTDSAHPMWSDTRARELILCNSPPGTPPAVCTYPLGNGVLANDQDVATDSIPLGRS
jgi:hypothetical protein